MALLAGVVVRVIFVATYVLTNGKASAADYIEAFTTGFIVGSTVFSVYASFRVAGTAVSGPGRAGLSVADDAVRQPKLGTFAA